MIMIIRVTSLYSTTDVNRHDGNLNDKAIMIAFKLARVFSFQLLTQWLAVRLQCAEFY